MVVVIDLKTFMKAKYHFHVEIQIRSQLYNLPRFNPLSLRVPIGTPRPAAFKKIVTFSIARTLP